MPEIVKLAGSHGFDQLLIPIGWQLNGASAPTVLRDGTYIASNEKMFTVVRTSIGLYTVSFAADGAERPTLPFLFPHIAQGAPPTTPCQIKEVKNSWAYSNGVYSFQVHIESVGTTPAASDGDVGDRVTVFIMGGLKSPGIDPA